MSHFQIPLRLYMTDPAITVAAGASLEEAFDRMTEAGISSLPVVEADGQLAGLISRTDLLRVGRRESGSRADAATDGQVQGVLSTRDLMRAIEDKQLATPLAELMSSPVFRIRAEEPISMAVERLEKARVSGLVVVEEDWPVGLFTQVEALEARDVRRSTPVGDVMSPRLLTLSPRTRVYRAAAQAASTGVRRIVVQDQDRVAGILSGLDFAKVVR